MLKSLLLKLLSMYQFTGPMRRPRCRYVPTCSEYASEAITSYGAASGSWLASKRILRCHPLGSSGLDPVPEK